MTTIKPLNGHEHIWRAAEARMSELETQRADLATQLATIEEQLAALETQRAELDTQHAPMQADESAYEQERQRLDVALDDATVQASLARGSTLEQEMDARVAAAQAALDDHAARKRAFEQQRAEFDAHYAATRERLAREQATAHEQHTRLAAQLDQLASARNEHFHAHGQEVQAALVADLERAAANVAEAEKRADDLRKHHAALQAVISDQLALWPDLARATENDHGAATSAPDVEILRHWRVILDIVDARSRELSPRVLASLNLQAVPLENLQSGAYRLADLRPRANQFWANNPAHRYLAYANLIDEMYTTLERAYHDRDIARRMDAGQRKSQG